MPAERIDCRCLRSPLHKDLTKLVFALLIVKAKPKSSSMSSYLLNIRKVVISGRALKSSQDALGRRESIQHYKDALENSEQSQKLLRIQNEKLEQDNQDLRDQLSNKTIDRNSLPHLATPSRDTTVVLESSEPGIALILDDLEVTFPPGEVSNHLRHLYSLNTILGQVNANSGEIARTLAEATASSLKLLTETGHTLDSATYTPILAQRPGRNMQANEVATKETAVMTTVICRTVQRILVGMDKLARIGAQEELEGHIHPLLALFSGILDLLNKDAEFSSGTPKRRKPPRKKQKRSHPSWVSEVDNLSTQFSLCELFVSMFANLEAEKAVHRTIMEGTMRCLLHRVGKLLRAFVFDGPFGEDKADAEDWGLDTARTMEAEAPYILWIFEKIMAFWRRKMRSSRSSNETINLGDRITKLQNTMLLAVFPSDHRSFVESLGEPLRTPGVGIDAGVVLVAEEDIRNHFKQEVNRLLGWNVLSKVIQWS